jgi:hypothetical protein
VKVITIWDIWNFRDRIVEFNHISDGYDPTAKEPTPIDEHQRDAWAGRNWHPRKAFLIDGVVVEESAEALERKKENTSKS